MSKTKAAEVRFSSKGQVVIPRHLREQFDIEEGTHALVQATEDGILLRPLTAASIARGFGILKRKGKSLDEEWAEHKREERRLEEPGDGRRRPR
jgi:AbrB family looped-hinge helix DNA binding protein